MSLVTANTPRVYARDSRSPVVLIEGERTNLLRVTAPDSVIGWSITGIDTIAEVVETEFGTVGLRLSSTGDPTHMWLSQYTTLPLALDWHAASIWVIPREIEAGSPTRGIYVRYN